jgi:hypothetical protein
MGSFVEEVCDLEAAVEVLEGELEAFFDLRGLNLVVLFA